MVQQPRTIIHNEWGKGTVLTDRHNGYELFVKFDNGVRSWIKKSECVYSDLPLKGEIEVKGPEKHKEQINETHRERLLILQAIEAFRLGIVPPFVKEFIFGRDRQIRYFDNWFDDQNVNHSLIFGEYGTGKTHFLHYMNEMAEKDNYAVSLCSIDPSESPLYKPKYVYHNIVKNIKYDKDKTFEDLIYEIQKNNKIVEKKNHYIRNIIKGDMDDLDFLNWVKGENLPKTYYGYPTLPPYTTAANLYCNLLSFFSYCCKTVLSLKGLLILIDEAESIFFPTYTYRFERSCNFFRGLRMTAEKDQTLFNEPKTTQTPIRGINTGLIYSGHRRAQIDYLYNKETALKLVFAFTPGQNIDRLCLESGYSQYIKLDPLNTQEKSQVIKTIQKFYQKGYAQEYNLISLKLIEEKIIDSNDENVRSIVKRTIESMDILRHYGDQTISELLQ